MTKVCMNDMCKDNMYLKQYHCSTDRPIIVLGRKCWNCHDDKYLVEQE